MGRIEEINREIEELQAELDSATGTKTEVYSRIVGYYRSLNNWNRGKSEEFVHRLTFTVPEHAPERTPSLPLVNESVTESAITAPVGFELFTRATCPNCPAMKHAVEEIGLDGIEIDVDTDAGIQRAMELSIYVTPTVVFFDATGTEVARITSVAELRSLFAVAVA